MKQSIILWISAIVITFLAGYLQSTTSPTYPAAGAISIEGKRVSYLFDKVYRGHDGYSVWIESELKDISGNLEWRDKGTENWNNVPFVDSAGIISAKIPNHPPLSKVEYRAKIDYKGKTYLAPETKIITITFFGKVSPQIMVWYFITLMGGILLAVRSGLEYFNDQGRSRIKMYTIFTTISFFLFTLAMSPVKRSSELGVIGKSQSIPITSMFTPGSLILFIVWIAALILVFNWKKGKLSALIAAILTLIVFQFGGF